MSNRDTLALGERLLEAIALHRSGRLEEAEQAYLAVLEADSDNAEALHYLGVMRFQQGQPAPGIELVQRALELKPDYVDAYNNLGNMYMKHRPADAVDAYRAALELGPDHPDVLRHHYSLAAAYANLGREEEAIATLRTALAVKPEAEGFFRLGQLLHRSGRTDELVQNYSAWLRAEPDNPVPGHMLAAHAHAETPARAADGYVVKTFDGFAETFDEVLIGQLEYRAPGLIGEAMARIEGEPGGALDIVDAGCGTGLLAQHLRPYARRLVGVDLSLKMLEKAATRARYDELVAAELTWYLTSSPGAFDIVASSDTLIYFGELREAFAAARTALRPGGRLFFTLEHAADEDDAPAGYRIHPHGRYSHTEPYVRRMLGEAGFELVEIGKGHLRRERADYVSGLIVVARLTSRATETHWRPGEATLRDNLARALELHQRGELHQAEAAYLAVLRADENTVEALHGLGRLRCRQGWLLAALNLLRRATDVDPAHVEAYVTLGEIHRQLGALDNAAQAFRKALELRPDHAEAARNLAPVLDELERLEQAAATHQLAFEQDPANAEHLLALASAYQNLDRADEELAALQKALAIRPDASAFARLGTLLRLMGRLDEAAALYAAWLRVEPDSAVASHLLAASTGKDVPGRASDAYVARGFDRYADSFDEALLRLEYRAPALVARALQRSAGEPRRELDVMDAGCGTGLLAPHLRPYARRLVGVDLSPKMLEKAAGRAAYDELAAAELTAYLAGSPRAFDIVASSDTLVYFGDLREVLAAVRGALRPGGRLLFTLEADSDDGPAGYRLHPDGRYKHTQHYVRTTLQAAGFEAIDVETGPLRRQGNRYVPGLIVTARAAPPIETSETGSSTGSLPPTESIGGLRERLSSAIALHRSGQLEEAEKVYVEVLEAEPDSVTALHFLGVLRSQQGHALQGIGLVKLAIEMQPDYVDAINNLGNIQLRSGATLEAAAAYKRALELRPDHPEALRNLGLALRKLKRHGEAAEMLERAIRRSPEKTENYYSLANAYKEMGREDDAVLAMRKALAIKPEGDGHRRLGQLLYALNRTAEAVANYEAWMRAEPDNPVPKHMLAACTLKDVPARAGDAFVVNVFDGFAESFDEVLMGRLEYRAPGLVGEAVKRLEGEPRGALDIVDAGCGTGLLAQYLRPYARRLVGVDLSTGMLQKARARGYDRLVAAELTSFLASAPEAFDMVGSSDTLVYFGDLREVLAAARRALRPGGRLVFTLEHTLNEQDAPAGYRIQPHGRYTHTQPYARNALAEAGFEAVEIVEVHLRREGRSYVDGLLVSARAGSAPSPVPPQRRGKPENVDPNDAQALRDLALMRHRHGESLSALHLLRRSIELEPAYADAYVSLGHIHRQLGSVAHAAQAYRKAIELRPGHAEAVQNLMPVQEELERLERSAATHRRALEQDPANIDHLLALASACRRLDRAEEERAALEKALAIRPEPDDFVRLATLLRGMGRTDEAAAVYEAWLRADPDSAIAKHMLAACTGSEAVSRAPEEFVTQEFDHFAESFDEVLRKLEYRAPALLASALRRVDGEPRGELDVLDAGCGTGLLAQHLRPYARRLVGVDLSPKMLEKAAARALYDELVPGELTSYLGLSPRTFDIVAASDTLCYFGELHAVLAAAGASLRPGGVLLFTLEHAKDDAVSAGYRLHPDGRYMHTEQYVRGALGRAGFEVMGIEMAVLRREGEAYVEGLVVTARRPQQ